MTSPAPNQPGSGKRARTSERALTIALKAIANAGLSVDKLLISGAQIEIHCGIVAEPRPLKNDGGPEDW